MNTNRLRQLFCILFLRQNSHWREMVLFNFLVLWHCSWQMSGAVDGFSYFWRWLPSLFLSLSLSIYIYINVLKTTSRRVNKNIPIWKDIFYRYQHRYWNNPILLEDTISMNFSGKLLKTIDVIEKNVKWLVFIYLP